jgi:hypothetical protein
MQKETFQHAGTEYEVRVISDGQSVFVKAFCGDKPANGYRYEVTLEMVHDAATVSGLDVVKHLIEIAKADIIGH